MKKNLEGALLALLLVSSPVWAQRLSFTDFSGPGAAAVRNQLVSQMDWAAQNNLPGLLSASSLPEGGYYGATGLPFLAEQMLNPSNLAGYYDTVLMNTGST